MNIYCTGILTAGPPIQAADICSAAVAPDVFGMRKSTRYRFCSPGQPIAPPCAGFETQQRISSGYCLLASALMVSPEPKVLLRMKYPLPSSTITDTCVLLIGAPQLSVTVQSGLTE